MVSRKRGREQMEATEPKQIEEPTMLERLRNTWELANLMQYIFLFGKILKIDEDLDIDDLEQECLKPEKSQVLNDIGLALLKYVSSHRGLTPELFDEYTRRQYVARAPQRNPFGEEEEPNKFVDLDVFLKLKVLVQLSQWTLINPDRLREKTMEVKESEQTNWRIEEIGWDKQERSYFVLDDNRLYRRTDPPPPPLPVAKAKPKSTSKKGKAAARASKRRKTIELEEVEGDADIDTGAEDTEKAVDAADDDGFGNRQWECIAVTLEQYQEFLASIQKSRDPEEKALHRRITETALPEIEKLEATHLRKKQKQERELLNLQKLATAKRSSRLEAKFEREKQEQEVAEAERKRREDLAAAKRDQDKQKVMEAARESRMMTREQRLKDREFKRLLHEEELANLSEENKKIEAGESQRSERHLKAEMERKKKDLAALQEEEEWVFDCAKCGVYGTNLDDGTPSIACEKCNVWQHTACLGFSQEEAKKDDFHFICRDCKRREEDAKKPKIPTLKFHIGSSSSPPQNQPKTEQALVNGAAANGVKRKSGDSGLPPTKKFKKPDFHSGHPAVGTNGAFRPTQADRNGMHDTVMNGPQLSPQGQLPTPLPPYNASHSPVAAKPQNHTNPGISSAWNPPSFINSQGPSTPSGHDSTGQGQAKDSTYVSHFKPQPYPPVHQMESQHNWQHTYQHPRPNSSSSQESYHAYTNGHGYQAPQPSYQQPGGGYPPPYGTHASYQAYGAHGPPNGPPTNGWSAHYASPPSTATRQLPPYAQSPPPPTHPNSREHGLASPKPLNNPKQLSTSPKSYPPGLHSAPKSEERPLSSHASNEYKDRPFTNSKSPLSTSQLPAPLLTPGPQSLIPQPNGHTYSPIPSTERSGKSPVKHPSPPTSFSHQPASSPISNQPPLQPSKTPISPGFSPQKHSPPPSSSIQEHFASAPAAPAAMPPAPKLSPAPTHAPLVAPLKHDVHSPGNPLPQDALAPILSPNSAPRDLPSPTKHAHGSTAQPVPPQARVFTGPR